MSRMKKKFVFISKGFTRLVGLLFFLFLVTFGLVTFQSLPPDDFPTGKVVSIESGSSTIDIAMQLEKVGLVRSAELFMFLLKLRSSSGFVLSGDYVFDKPIPAFFVVDRLSRGVYGPSQVRVTIPEGSTNKQIADAFAKSLKNFDKEEFFSLANEKQGYLFPDTYLVFPSADASYVVSLMENNFWKKARPLFEKFAIPEAQWNDYVIMASIVEREAFGDNFEEHQMVAGVLWRRIEIGMPLQVDATLYYLLGKPSSKLTREDLRIDSPYNTYVYKGLPPGPISNPGEVALETTINYVKSDYLFYLHSPDGTIHYAKTHDQHVLNKQRYLR